jgi:hypothetical protein
MARSCAPHAPGAADPPLLLAGGALPALPEASHDLGPARGRGDREGPARGSSWPGRAALGSVAVLAGRATTGFLGRGRLQTALVEDFVFYKAALHPWASREVPPMHIGSDRFLETHGDRVGRVPGTAPEQTASSACRWSVSARTATRSGDCCRAHRNVWQCRTRSTGCRMTRKVQSTRAAQGVRSLRRCGRRALPPRPVASRDKGPLSGPGGPGRARTRPSLAGKAAAGSVAG